MLVDFCLGFLVLFLFWLVVLCVCFVWWFWLVGVFFFCFAFPISLPPAKQIIAYQDIKAFTGTAERDT